MITSKVTASVSRRGNDASGATGNPPPTSEKLVTTEVCGKSGEPVVLSGLVQTAESEQEKRSPLISKIPILGKLFKAENKTRENLQMVIYLVPHVSMGEDEGAGNGFGAGAGGLRGGVSLQADYDWAREDLWALYAEFYEKEESDE